MIAAALLLTGCQAQTCADGRRREVEDDGEIWTYYPLCVKCGHKFAVPDSGLVCCVCLAGKKPSKIKDL